MIELILTISLNYEGVNKKPEFDPVYSPHCYRADSMRYGSFVGIVERTSDCQALGYTDVYTADKRVICNHVPMHLAEASHTVSSIQIR